jgi:hypothetical protein
MANMSFTPKYPGPANSEWDVLQKAFAQATDPTRTRVVMAVNPNQGFSPL